MIKYISSILIVVVWAILLGKVFPSDHEKSNAYTIIVYFVVILWGLLGILLLVSKRKVPSAFVFLALTLISCFSIYTIFPWYDGYRPLQLIKDYSKKRDSIKSVEIEWIYSLPPRIENYPLIDLAQREFVKEVNPDKCYLFQSFYYDSSQVQQYVDKYIIYFKDTVPLTTNASATITHNSDGTYQLTETIDGKELAFIYIKNGHVKLSTSKDSLEPNGANDNFYLSSGKYRFELKRTDVYSGFNIREAFWIYKFL